MCTLTTCAQHQLHTVAFFCGCRQQKPWKARVEPTGRPIWGWTHGVSHSHLCSSRCRTVYKGRHRSLLKDRYLYRNSLIMTFHERFCFPRFHTEQFIPSKKIPIGLVTKHFQFQNKQPCGLIAMSDSFSNHCRFTGYYLWRICFFFGSADDLWICQSQEGTMLDEKQYIKGRSHMLLRSGNDPRVGEKRRYDLCETNLCLIYFNILISSEC